LLKGPTLNAGKKNVNRKNCDCEICYKLPKVLHFMRAAIAEIDITPPLGTAEIGWLKTK
jgi:hypothetical protein